MWRLGRHEGSRRESPSLDRLAKVAVWPCYRPSSALDLDLREDNDYFGGIIRRYKIGAQ